MKRDTMSRTATYDSKGNEIFNSAYSQVNEEVTHFMGGNQESKADAGKPNLTLVPTQIVRDIAQVREYGNSKYGSRDNWKNVELERYIAALYRHLLSVVEDPLSVDPESGIEHYKHIACNAAFICEILKGEGKE